jgi:predicted dehydrogenase/RimJ/RimL family protein N-acetyltransferase
MRLAVLGQGSIGRRHAANALALGHQANVYDPSPTVRPPAGVERRQSVAECLAGVDAAIVASPSSEHAAHTRAALEQGVALLVEKPLALDCVSAAELDWLARERGVLLSAAMNLREHPGVLALRSLLAEGAVGTALHARAWCGSWLPAWHPHEDYRERYSARRELGGGVLLDVAVHELDYLLWLLGPARAVSALTRHTSQLQIDVEDVAAIALELESGAIAEVSVDYLDRRYARGCRIVGSERTLRWSWEDERVDLHGPDGELARVPAGNDVDATYRLELERFLEALRADAPAPVPAAEAQRTLAVIDAARRSAREGRRVALAPAVELRAARREDAELLLAWRNDADTRRWSLSSQEIAPEQHRRWLERVLSEDSAQLWVIEDGARPVGQVRVDAGDDGAGQVHIALAPQARGRGIGAAALTQACARALAQPRVRGLHARVKQGNEASLRAFDRAGFRAVGAVQDGVIRLQRRGHVGVGRRDAAVEGAPQARHP